MVTYEGAKATLADARNRWRSQCALLTEAVCELRVLCAEMPDPHNEEVTSYAEQLRATLESSNVRRRCLRELEVMIALGSRVGMQRTGPRLVRAFEAFESINERQIRALEEQCNLLVQSVQTLRKIREQGESLPGEIRNRLSAIALYDSEAAEQLLDRELANAELDGIAAENLSSSLAHRLDTAMSWAAMSADMRSAEVEEYLSYFATVNADRQPREHEPPSHHVARLLNAHEGLDPRLRILGDRARAVVHELAETATAQGFADAVSLFSGGRQALGVSHAEFRKLKSGLAALQNGRIGGRAESAVACWNYLGQLMTGIQVNKTHTTQTGAPQMDTLVESQPWRPEGTSRQQLEQLLSRFLVEVAPVIVADLSELYGSRFVQCAVVQETRDGFGSFDAERILEFTYRNWNVGLSRRFGENGKLFVDRLRQASYALNASRPIAAQSVEDALSALEYLEMGTRRVG